MRFNVRRLHVAVGVVMIALTQWQHLVSAMSSGQWRRQRSKGARSFWGQNILQPGQPDALFSSKKSTTFFSRRPQNTKAANAAEIVSLSK